MQHQYKQRSKTRRGVEYAEEEVVAEELEILIR